MFVVAFFEFLKSEGIGDLELAKLKVLLAKDSDGHLKNNLFFVQVLSYFDLVVPPKGSFFYLRALYYNSEKRNYFSFNSIGLSEIRLGYYLSKEFLVDYIDPIVVSDEITTLAAKNGNT